MHCSHSSCNAYGSTFASRFSVTPWVIRGSGLFFHVLSSHRGRSTIIRGSISTNESFLNASYRKREKEKNTLLIGYRCRYIHRINVNVEWSEMKCIAITSTRGQLCQTISLAYGDCSFIMTQIIQTGTISDNIEFSFTTASANAYLHKA